jgi:hypothetical protein
VTDHPQLPPVVTFSSGAELLVELEIIKSITREGVRHIANTHPHWPFGPGRPFPYWHLANALVMETEPFLRFFRETYQRDGTG